MYQMVSDRVTLAGGASTTATLSAGDTVILDAGGGAELFSFTVASITTLLISTWIVIGRKSLLLYRRSHTSTTTSVKSI